LTGEKVMSWIKDILFEVHKVISYFPYWTSAWIFAVAAIWLHLKVRRKSTFVMMIGFTLSAGLMILRYFDGSIFYESSTIDLDSNANSIENLFHLATLSYSHMANIVGLVGFIWFVAQVKPRRVKSPNKSLNTDASDAGAG
jgi:predicted histidine transporter YuiF (NhaC family)